MSLIVWSIGMSRLSRLTNQTFKLFIVWNFQYIKVFLPGIMATEDPSHQNQIITWGIEFQGVRLNKGISKTWGRNPTCETAAWWSSDESESWVQSWLKYGDWEQVGLVLGGNINRSRAQEDQWPLQPGRSGLSPISAADINPSSLTHLYWCSKYWDQLNYQRLRVQLWHIINCYSIQSSWFLVVCQRYPWMWYFTIWEVKPSI